MNHIRLVAPTEQERASHAGLCHALLVVQANETNVIIVIIVSTETRYLHRCCSNWSLCVTNVNNTGCTFEDLYRLVYYNNSYYMGSLPHYQGDFYLYYNVSTQTLLPHLCDTMMPGIVLSFSFVLRVNSLRETSVMSSGVASLLAARGGFHISRP